MGTIQKWNLAIVGATGQVGKELLSVLSVSGFPSNSIRFLRLGTPRGSGGR